MEALVRKCDVMALNFSCLGDLIGPDDTCVVLTTQFEITLGFFFNETSHFIGQIVFSITGARLLIHAIRYGEVTTISRSVGLGARRPVFSPNQGSVAQWMLRLVDQSI